MSVTAAPAPAPAPPKAAPTEGITLAYVNAHLDGQGLDPNRPFVIDAVRIHYAVRQGNGTWKKETYFGASFYGDPNPDYELYFLALIAGLRHHGLAFDPQALRHQFEICLVERQDRIDSKTFLT